MIYEVSLFDRLTDDMIVPTENGMYAYLDDLGWLTLSKEYVEAINGGFPKGGINSLNGIYAADSVKTLENAITVIKESMVRGDLSHLPKDATDPLERMLALAKAMPDGIWNIERTENMKMEKMWRRIIIES